MDEKQDKDAPVEGNPVDPKVEKMMRASNRSVNALTKSQIMMYFNQEKKHCLLSMDALCQKLGLSFADRKALLERVVSMGLRPPR